MANVKEEVIYLTREKYEELQKELRELKTKGRAEVARKIAEARAHGDISENSEYETAKQEQELLELKIQKLEETLAKARIIDVKNTPTDKVYLYSKVKLLNLDTNQEVEYTIVSSQEANSAEKKISLQSPIGKSLLGKRVGEVVEVKVPIGILRFKILEITK
ncbi:transcription elongation factor GreA [Candidatus Chrysopegis kryptomonas]|jgi:transcription elongation factor GreA|uniref:Transcription elongation factor GreA n=1 Tax=Candidatus Chryseopegocella kryptomonas TaxID=1633643 RepID=A0A0P1P088_9BACT|nr:transcription elongation factor GreA [Candidatus Chrysopegis kryptomonas]CUT04741.1 transcription elongation factor GreA [Candidatus Chrysopegis kryptomonas]